MPDASLVIRAEDRYSENIRRMSQFTKSFNKDVDDLEEQLRQLNAQKVSLKLDADQANRALKEAQKQFAATGDEADGLKVQLQQANYDNIKRNFDLVTRAARDTERQLSKTGEAGKQVSGGFGSTLSALGQAGLYSMLGGAASQVSGVVLESYLGQPLATAMSSTLSGVASGAAIGSIIPGIGTAVGAAIGGLAGAVTGGSQIYEAQDDAFKQYYTSLYDAQRSATGESLSAGGDTAAQRELDAIAFNRLLGDGTGDQYLSSLRALAADTPMEYGDLTGMSRALATGFGDSPERMLELMTAIGDAGSAVGMTAADMEYMAQAMSRMNSSGKATLEYLNIFQDRGVDVIGMLSEAMGKTQGEIYDMISRGEIGGQDAVNIIQTGMESAYSGAMETMAGTYEGLTSTLQDAMTEIDTALGSAYNEKSKEGLQEDIDAYGGALGDALSQANQIIGEGRAIAENLDRRYSREALSALTLGTETTVFGADQAARLEEMHGQYTALMEEYQTATEEDKAVIASQIEALKTEAQAMADSAYDASEMSQSLHDVNLDLIAAIRENTAALSGTPWLQDYEVSQEESKGLASTEAVSGGAGEDSGDFTDPASANYSPIMMAYSGLDVPGYATGLDRVPYDNYPAILHEGERVLTASQARSYDRGGGTGGGIVINMNGAVIREESDIEKVAQALYERLVQARTAGVYG